MRAGARAASACPRESVLDHCLAHFGGAGPFHPKGQTTPPCKQLNPGITLKGKEPEGPGRPPRSTQDVRGCKFPRAERLTRRSEYQFVFAHGSKAVGRSFICYVARREGQGSKLGIAVSRKVGNAVVRNRVKRYIREFYRTHRRFIRQPAQVVVVARPSAARLSYHECVEALQQGFQRGGVLE